jgi:hypothetical protein
MRCYVGFGYAGCAATPERQLSLYKKSGRSADNLLESNGYIADTKESFMKTNRIPRWITVVTMVTTLVVGSLGSHLAVADIVGTETLLQEQNGTVTRDELQSMIARADVQEKLIDYGISPEEASDRVAALTNAELQHLAQHIDEEPAGGSVTLILLIIILVILLR